MARRRAPTDVPDARYVVRVDDNGRYMDEEARWTLGRFADAESALAACRRLVDRSLDEAYKPGMTADALLSLYKMFGDDPFIVALHDAPECRFSAWTYAEGRAAEMCRVTPT